MEEHAGRRHKGPEAAAQTGRGESKVESAFSSSPSGFPTVKMEGKSERIKASPLRQSVLANFLALRSTLRTVEMDQVGRYPEESVYIHITGNLKPAKQYFLLLN